MSRFGIRKRLKGMIGGGVSRAPQIVQCEVTFVLPDGSEHSVIAEEHYTLVMASQALPSPIQTGCPDGGCGTCRVEVLSDLGLSPMGDAEREVIEKNVKEEGAIRLGCHTKIRGSGAKIRVFELFDFASVLGNDE